MVNIYCYVFCWSFSKYLCCFFLLYCFRPNLVNPNPGVTAIYNSSNIYIEYICNKLPFKNYFSIVSVNFTESWNTYQAATVKLCDMQSNWTFIP